MAIYSSSDTPKYLLESVSLVIVLCGIFLWNVFTISTGENKHIKVIYLKCFGLVVYGFRVFLVNNFADLAYKEHTKGNIATLILLCVAIVLIVVISVLL
jgi:surface polysaccharide O-acyltransferase-like enzyme